MGGRKFVLLANFFQTTALVFSLFCPNQYQEVPLRQTKKRKGVFVFTAKASNDPKNPTVLKSELKEIFI